MHKNGICFSKLCFAYKISQPLNTLYFTVQDIYGNTINSQASLNTTADFNWNYVCVDLYASLKSYDSTFKTAANLLKLMSVSGLFS